MRKRACQERQERHDERHWIVGRGWALVSLPSSPSLAPSPAAFSPLLSFPPFRLPRCRWRASMPSLYHECHDERHWEVGRGCGSWPHPPVPAGEPPTGQCPPFARAGWAGWAGSPHSPVCSSGKTVPCTQSQVRPARARHAATPEPRSQVATARAKRNGVLVCGHAAGKRQANGKRRASGGRDKGGGPGALTCSTSPFGVQM